MRVKRAVVLAGGGFAASAWETGVLSGMAAAGVDLRDSDLFIGTSAGARVALSLALGSDLDELYHRQFQPPAGQASPPGRVDWPKVREDWAGAKRAGRDSADILRRVGSLALATSGIDNGERRNIIATQLPVQTWPAKPLWMVAVNAETGERRAFDGASGAALVDALAATTAFFGWPAMVIQGQTYIDGGFYSSDNADLAADFDEVLVFALRAPAPSLNVVSLDETVERLKSGGSQVQVIQPDEECLEALSAGSAMNPAIRGPVASAARIQGQKLAERGILF